MSWKIVYTKQAQKDAKKIKQAGLQENVQKLFEILRENPFQNPPPYEKLIGDLHGAYSRRITIKHRLVYEICKGNIIKIIRLWTHYE